MSQAVSSALVGVMVGGARNVEFGGIASSASVSRGMDIAPKITMLRRSLTVSGLTVTYSLYVQTNDEPSTAVQTIASRLSSADFVGLIKQYGAGTKMVFVSSSSVTNISTKKIRGRSSSSENENKTSGYDALPTEGKVLVPIVVIMTGVLIIYLMYTYREARLRGMKPIWQVSMEDICMYCAGKSVQCFKNTNSCCRNGLARLHSRFAFAAADQSDKSAITLQAAGQPRMALFEVGDRRYVLLNSCYLLRHSTTSLTFLLPPIPLYPRLNPINDSVVCYSATASEAICLSGEVEGEGYRGNATEDSTEGNVNIDAEPGDAAAANATFEDDSAVGTAEDDAGQPNNDQLSSMPNEPSTPLKSDLSSQKEGVGMGTTDSSASRVPEFQTASNAPSQAEAESSSPTPRSPVKPPKTDIRRSILMTILGTSPSRESTDGVAGSSSNSNTPPPPPNEGSDSSASKPPPVDQSKDPLSPAPPKPPRASMRSSISRAMPSISIPSLSGPLTPPPLNLAAASREAATQNKAAKATKPARPGFSGGDFKGLD